jgi:hypothetical protein
LQPLSDARRGQGPWGRRCGGKPGWCFLALAVLVFLPAAARARVVVTDLFSSHGPRRQFRSFHLLPSRLHRIARKGEHRPPAIGDVTGLFQGGTARNSSRTRSAARVKVGMAPLSRRPLTAPRQARGRRSWRSSESSRALPAIATGRLRRALTPPRGSGLGQQWTTWPSEGRGCVNPIAHTGRGGAPGARRPIRASNAPCMQRRGPTP